MVLGINNDMCEPDGLRFDESETLEGSVEEICRENFQAKTWVNDLFGSPN